MMPALLADASPYCGYVAAPLLSDPVAALWIDLRYALSPVSIQHLVLERDHDVSRCLRLIGAWAQAGLVTILPTRPEAYLMTDAARRRRTPPDPVPARMTRPRRRASASNIRARIWYAARSLRRFDLVELGIAADLRPERARHYLNLLVRGGYLHRSDDRYGQPVYRLARDPGPDHPRLRFIAGVLTGSDAPTQPPAPAPHCSAALFFEGER